MFVSHEQQVIERAGSSGASAAQTGIILRDGGHEVLLLRTTYRGPAEDFAWVVPVPRAPDGADDLFTASGQFIDRALSLSKPRQSLLTGQHAAQAAAAKRADSAQARKGTVEVLLRRQVGEYDASVLAAGDAGALTRWLEENGYRLPSNATPIVADYIRRGWVFIAMRVLDWVRAQKPVLESVTPIGVRFRTEPLVFPLAISRVSAPEMTSVLLLVYDRGPVRCRELPIRYAEPGTPIRRGDSYERIRERLVSAAEPALFCEALGPGVAGPDGNYRSEGGARPTYDRSNRKLWVSRFWTRIDRDDMVDLTFDPDREPREPYRLAIELGAPGTVLAGSPGGARSSVVESAPARTRRGPSPVAYVAVPLALIALAVILRSRRGLGPIAALAAVASLSLPGHVRAGPGGGSTPEWVMLLGQAQEAIEDAVKAFAADTGCYPASLADLTLGGQVSRGVDASGNPVRLMVRPTRAYLAELPVDVLTERSDTWLMSVAGGAVVQSGGLEGVVRREHTYGRQDVKSWGWSNPGFAVGRAHVGSRRDRSLPERTDSAPETRSFWASEVVREGRFAAIASPAGDKPWGVVAVGKDETAVLLGSGMTTPTTGPDAPKPGYARAVEGWGIRKAVGGAQSWCGSRPRRDHRGRPNWNSATCRPKYWFSVSDAGPSSSVWGTVRR